MTPITSNVFKDHRILDLDEVTRFLVNHPLKSFENTKVLTAEYNHLRGKCHASILASAVQGCHNLLLGFDTNPIARLQVKDFNRCLVSRAFYANIGFASQHPPKS
jgi:hypothetical protein